MPGNKKKSSSYLDERSAQTDSGVYRWYRETVRGRCGGGRGGGRGAVDFSRENKIERVTRARGAPRSRVSDAKTREVSVQPTKGGDTALCPEEKL